MNSMRALAREAGEAARRILRGEAPSDVRLTAMGPGAPVYDGRELQRFGIDAARLSPGSTIRFRAPSFWDANRWIVLGVVGIVGLEAALIAILVVNLAGRKRAEEELRDMSRRLIVGQEEERARLGREQHDDITQRLARLAIDTAAAGQGRADASGSDAMRRISEGLIRLSEDVHALSYRLHPSLVEDLGFFLFLVHTG